MMAVMGRVDLDLEELVEHWTLLDDERDLIARKRGPTRLGFAVLLKFYVRHARFPAWQHEIPDDAVAFVAAQVEVPAELLVDYDWSGRTVRFHQMQIRRHLGTRECSVEDADKLTGWLASEVCERERRPDRVRGELLGRCRSERIEPPTAGRVDRLVRAGLHRAEVAMTTRIAGALAPTSVERLHALISTPNDDDAVGSALAELKASPGNVSLESMLSEIRKLRLLRSIGLPAGLFADVAPAVVAGWRTRATIEAPSHLRTHPHELRLTLLAALVHTREEEVTDTLVDLLISTVHRINARADRRVTAELVNAFKRVTGKENILFAIAEASLNAPDDPVRDVVYPAVGGGEQTLRELVHEYKTKGPVYRRTVQTTLRASYTNHYRRGLIELLEVLEFRSNNSTHRPVLDALDLVRRHRDGRTRFYPAGEIVPTHRGLVGDWGALVFNDDAGVRRVVRSTYEICTFQALREQLRCKEIWVVGAARWRNPDEDLPHDFDERRIDHYRALRKPLDSTAFIDADHHSRWHTLRPTASCVPDLGRRVSGMDGTECSGSPQRRCGRPSHTRPTRRVARPHHGHRRGLSAAAGDDGIDTWLTPAFAWLDCLR